MDDIELDRERIERFLEAAAGRLDGELVLLGGSLAALWFMPGRRTLDIDLVDLAPSSERRLTLFDIMDEQHLPITSVNAAAEYFLRRIPDWRDQLEVLREGRARILRPTPTLFVLLKLGRLSEADLDDCLALVEHAGRHALPMDLPRLLAAMASLPPATDSALETRRDRLAATLSARLPG